MMRSEATFIRELRSQLNEQLRALDGRVDTQTALVGELQDWFRRRAELHQDYSFKLDKLAKSLQARHKEQKYKREQLHLLSVYSCWNSLVNQTRKDARDHAAMADVYLNNIIPRFTQVQDDVQRIYKRCREIGYESHEELLKVLHELHTTMRTYHTYQTEFKNAETKLRNFEAQRSKLEQGIPKEKLEKSKKFRVIEKEIQKRSNKYMDAKLKALKARNEYILSMDSANAAIHKYFVEDLSDIVDCMDFGFHSSIARALLTHVSGQECLRRSLQGGIDDINKTINNLDSRLDKQRFLEFNNAAFMLPKKFEFQGHKGDETHEDSTTTQVNQVVVNRHVQEEMEKRYAHLVSRLTSLKTESEETWKTIETAEKTLMEMIHQRDYDCAHYFVDEPRPDNKQPESMLIKMKADRQETEDFYLSKFREYTLGSNLITRLQARYELMRKALGDETQASSSPTPTRNLVNKTRRRRIGGRNPLMGQPKLFGGSLEEYLEASGQEIPLIMKSCIRVINLYGLHHQGIFRVSGSQVEINNFRESFERMEDPLADVTDASDINSVAGVLKLYLRELREPLFPTVFFDQFMEIAPLEKKHDFVVKMRDVVTSLPRPVFVVMRYLFAFLNHLSEFSDENMMDPYNLAICFGPTLVPIPEDKDQVQYQNLVNELIKNIIIFSEDIFPSDGGHVYEKYISRDSIDLEVEVGEAPSEAHDDVDSEPGQSEDDSVFRDKDIALQIFGKSEILEAIAQFDFMARSERELSFNKGDVLVLHSQVSSDWWRGSFQGKQGLIPDKYILLKIRDEDKDRLSDRGAAEQLRRRASSSSESILSSSTQQSSEGVIKPTPHNGAAQAPLSPSPASVQSQDSCASPVSRDGLGGASSSLGLDSGGVSDGAQADGGRSTSPLPSTPGQASHSPTPPHSLQHGACLSLSDVSSIVSVQEEERQFISSECALQVSMQGEGGGHATSSPSSPQPTQHPSCPLLEPVTQSVAPALVEETNEEAQMEESPKGKNLEQLSSSMINSSTSGDSATRGPLSRSMLVQDDAGERGVGCQWEQRPRCPSQSSTLSSSSSEELNHSSPSPRTFWERRAKLKPAAGAPDLVMDLPVTPLSSSPKEQGGISPRIRRPHLHRESQSYDSSSSSGGSSPGTQSPDMTPGEVFAKQNLNTLKKTPALKTFGSHSTDAQTQTFLAHKLTSSLSLAQRNTEATELRITEAEEPTSVSSIVCTLDPAMRSVDSEGRSERKVSSEVRVEIKSASDRPPERPAPSTPKLAAKYLEAVALSTGGTQSVVKPPVGVKPSVLKKPSLTRGSPEPEPSK